MATHGQPVPPPGGDTSIALRVVVACGILEVIAITLFVARIITRWRRNGKLYIEDYLISGAIVRAPALFLDIWILIAADCLDNYVCTHRCNGLVQMGPSFLLRFSSSEINRTPAQLHMGVAVGSLHLSNT